MKWFFLLLALPCMSYAQMSAFFETTFYLEDGAGNRDTLIVGHDESANAFFNPQFGETDITNPWDSIFEARAAHLIGWTDDLDNVVLSKKIIGSNEGGLHPEFECLFFNEAIILFVRVIHFPLKVSWIRNDFAGSYCRNGSTITPHMQPLVSEYWHFDLQQDVGYACLAERDSFLVNEFIYDFGFFYIDEIEGGFIDTMAAILYYSKYQNAFETPCTATVSSTDIFEPGSRVLLYPNPTNDVITISEGDDCNWTIFNPVSNQVQNGNGSSVDVSTLCSGFYYISIYSKSKKINFTGKFVKI